jgi:hypothetical protein
LQEDIRDHVLAAPESEQPQMVSLMASWARTVAENPLFVRPSHQRDFHADDVNVDNAPRTSARNYGYVGGNFLDATYSEGNNSNAHYDRYQPSSTAAV